MATSVIELCNNALNDIGEEAIASLTDNTKAARLCNQRWPAVRDAVLRAHPWNCATAQAELAASAAPPPWQYAASFPLQVAYIRRIDDPRLFDPLLSEALTARLSATLAYPITASTSLAQAFWAMYAEKLREARGVDAREASPLPAPAPTTWLSAKLGR